MKWLLLLTLIASCGKHEQPKAVDFKDDDGDQILNFEETGIEKDIAHVPLVGKVTGVLRIYGDETVDLPLSNALTTTTAIDFFAKVEERVKPEDHFSEWSKLNLTKKPISFQSSQTSIEFEVLPDSISDSGGALYLTEGKVTTKLEAFDGNKYKARLDKQKVLDIVSGKSTLSLSKKIINSPLFHDDAQDTIKEKTYRVHFFDGKKDSVLYVSKNLTPPELFSKLGIVPEYVLENELFINISQEEKWYYREFKNGEKALVFAKGLELRDKYLSYFNYQKTTLVRENGSNKNTISFKNFSGAKILFRVRDSEKFVRTFSESTGSSQGRYGGRDGDPWQCSHYFRRVNSEKPITTSINDSLFEMGITSGVEAVSFTPYRLGLEDENEDPYAAVIIEAAGANMQVTLKAMPQETFTTTGEYKTNCGRDFYFPQEKAYQTNVEAKMNVILETFVEKNLE